MSTKKKFSIPHIYVILFLFIALAAVSTYLIPAGSYERVPGPDGRTTIDPNSYVEVEQTPVSLIQFMTAIPKGLVDAGEVVFFTFIIGGLFAVLKRTGLIEIGVDRLTRKFSARSIVLIPVLMVMFAIICSLIGTQELSLVYVPVILPLMIALGYDSVVAAAVALVATTAGFTTGFLNPVTTGLGQKISGLPLFSGIEIRIIAFIVFVLAGIIYIIRYARKVKNDPKTSLVYEEDTEKRAIYLNDTEVEKRIATKRQKIASFVLLGCFILLVYGVLKQNWFMTEMAGLFIIMGIVVGMIAGLKLTDICESFNEGFREVLVGAMIVGVARAVAVVMEEGQVMDTIVYSLGTVVGGFPAVFSAIGMFIVQLLFNFLVPSGSGQALVTMPIMAPLSDLIGVTRQTAVLAFQFGDGIGNILYPTSGYFMATLALAGVAWQKWVRFYLPLFFIWCGIAIVFLIIAQVIQWNG
ncbi:YfcC family protein [Metabacillus fastidiosus]|uniref:YfcC family protein n=1 Tax=Metabacillus fastidiosus TaxID=1458 RepID=UPI002DBC29A3|nr:TIGR00366 family protein [Metabacillus fastidiosus]MEC2077135.1 TIGR00366 family protein [Metabacillus fastidiosus]